MAERENKDPLIGKTLGNYKILRELGRRGMGMVYEARQVSLNRDVALVLPSSLVLITTAVVRFRRGRWCRFPPGYRFIRSARDVASSRFRITP